MIDIGTQKYPLMRLFDGDEVAYELETSGICVVKSVLSEELIANAKAKLSDIYKQDLKEYGEDWLASSGELGQLRALVLRDKFFEVFVKSDFIDGVLERFLSPTSILHLINGIVTKPSEKHNQSKFHRDFAKPFISNRPLSLNIFYPLVDFGEDFGGTYFLPGSHKVEGFPSNSAIKRTAKQINCSAGDAIIFDSMLIHAGASNQSNQTRFAINTQFTLPFIKQQIDLPVYYETTSFVFQEEIEQRLGCWSVAPKSTKEFRFGKNGRRTYRSGQG